MCIYNFFIVKVCLHMNNCNLNRNTQQTCFPKSPLYTSQIRLSGPFSGVSPFLATEKPLKMTKNDFYFTFFFPSVI